MTTGKFIVIEGTDASGKKTQTDLLYDSLGKLTENILVADFPRYYDSPFGRMAGEFLAGKYGDFKKTDPHLALLPYMIDQYTWSRDIGRPFVDGGGIIISNRYFTSNVHQISKVAQEDRSMFRDWLWSLGYEHLGLLKPDKVIFLDVPPEISWELNEKKTDRAYLGGQKKDEVEKDWNHQYVTHQEFLIQANEDPTWVRINCISEGGIMSPQEIHNQVLFEAKKVLGPELLNEGYIKGERQI